MKVKIYIKLILILCSIILLIVGSYSWFADKANPIITGESIKVAAADGLVIKLTPDSAARTVVNLNELFNSRDEFELKQLSSADAVNFYKIDFGQGLSIEKPEFVKVDTEINNSMILNGYIDYDFYLETEDYAKYVYLHKDTSLTGDASQSIRVAVTYLDSSNNNQVCIFGINPENGITDPYTTKAVIAEGEFDYTNISQQLVSDQYVRTFESKDGGRGASDEEAIDITKTLMMIPANTQVKVNVKIWLEGGDIYCDNQIASTYVDLLLKFGSANVLLSKPNVTPNVASYTINNLTTDMEWSLTNDKDSIWYRVIDPNMTFVGKNTVYVRIAEVVGETPESYATEVKFN